MSETETTIPITGLPDDLIIYILEYLPVKDIISFSKCNRLTNMISKLTKNEHEIKLNISKIGILSQIKTFPNINFKVHLINDKYTDINIEYIERYLIDNDNDNYYYEEEENEEEENEEGNESIITKSICKKDNLSILKDLNNISELKLSLNSYEYKLYLPESLEILSISFNVSSTEYYDEEDDNIIDNIFDNLPLKLKSFAYHIPRDITIKESYENNAKNLEELSISSSNITDIHNIKQFTNLTYLSIVTNFITDNSIFSYMSNNLLELNLPYYKGDSIDKIINLVKLKKLNLKHSSISDIYHIRRLENLEELNFEHNTNLVNIFPISFLKNLKKLNLSDCRNLEDISYLESNTKLQELKLSETKVSDLKPLKNLKDLVSLDLFGCYEITDIKCISHIKKLDLSFCDQIYDFSYLGDNDELRLFYTEISDVSNLARVKTLDISSCNNIHDISSLANVESIDIRLSFGITDISMLRNIKEISASYIDYDDLYPFTIAEKILIRINDDLQEDFSFKIFKNCKTLEIDFTIHNGEIIVDKSFENLTINGNGNVVVLNEKVNILRISNIKYILNIENANLVI